MGKARSLETCYLLHSADKSLDLPSCKHANKFMEIPKKFGGIRDSGVLSVGEGDSSSSYS